ncbi:hypothetical protein B0H10DRAFT_942661 [Mycena sp. CBHHK59/15]|nr:hypothetical protein B0H10DRAFT_942661 [Mycena sp. CBHHK59/15]
MDEKDLKEFADDVKQAVEQFQFATVIRARLADHRQEKQLENIQSTQKMAHDNAVFRDRARLVYELPRAENAHYNTGKLGAHSTCFQGTRVEVMRTIMSWLEADDDHSAARLFWLNGLAGIGKSTIAKTIAGLADTKGILAGSFFFARGDEKLTDPTVFFPTLAFQVAQLDVALKSSIGQVLESNAQYAYDGIQTQLQKLIIEPLSTSFPLTKRKRLVFIVDALDECRDEELTARIVVLLLSHLRLIPFVRVVLTSRPESHIQRAFSETADHSEYILHNIEQTVVQGDIRLYLGAKLKAIGSSMVAAAGNELAWPRQEDIERLVQMSGTLFVYAATSVRFLGVRNHVRRMHILLGVHQATGTKPYAQLDELYMQILRNGLPLDDVTDTELDIFQWVVGTLMLLRDPLSLSTLSAFTQVAFEDVIVTLTYLQSIIVVPSSPDQPPQIYHPSFRDFLTLPERCSEPRYAIHPHGMEKRLTLRCLNLLSNGHLRRNMLGLSHFTLLNEDIVDLEVLLKTAFPPEFQYACLHWSSHLQGVELDDGDVASALYSFASTYMLFWFEAMSLLKQISRSITAMRDAHEWTKHSSHAQLKTLMYDGYRFALSHQSTIEAGALQVYQSALPFTPHSTLLYKTYAFEEAQSLHIVRGIPAEWSACLSSVSGAHRGITAVAYSHDGSLFALGYTTPFITVRAASSGGLLSTFEYPGPQKLHVLSLAFLPGDRYIVAATTEGIISKWSVLTASIVRSYEGHTSAATCIALTALTPIKMASASLDTTIRLWDVETGHCNSVLSCHGSPVRAISYTSDDTRLLSGSEDGIVRIWDTSEYCELRSVSAHNSSIGALAISPDNRSYCTGGADCLVKIFSMDADEPIFTLADHTKQIIWLTYTDEGATLLSVGGDPADDTEEYYCRLWDTSNGRLKRLSRGNFTQGAFSPNGEQLITGSRDSVCRIWAARDTSTIKDPMDHSDWVRSVVFSPDGKLLATGGNENDKNVKIWDVVAGTHMHTLRGHGSVIHSLAFSSDGSMLASGSSDRTVYVWDVASGRLLSYIGPHDGYVLRVEFTRDDRKMTSRTPRDTYTWDLNLRNIPLEQENEETVAVGKLLNKRPEHNERDSKVPVGTSDGYHVYMDGDDEHMMFMGKEGGDSARMVGAVQKEYRITGFKFHTDRVVIVCTDGSVLILDVSSLKNWL